MVIRMQMVSDVLMKQSCVNKQNTIILHLSLCVCVYRHVEFCGWATSYTVSL